MLTFSCFEKVSFQFLVNTKSLRVIAKTIQDKTTLFSRIVSFIALIATFEWYFEKTAEQVYLIL